MIETLMLDTRKCDSPVGKARIAPLRRGERNNTPLTVSVRRDRRPYDLTGMTAHLLWQTADGKLVGPIPMEVSDPAAGTVRCTLPDACYSAVGMARAYIELRRGAELVDTTDELVVKVLDCIDADAEQAEEYKPLLGEVQDAIAAAKKATESANAAETERKTAETEREVAEQGRVAAEETRVAEEQARKTAEQGRVTAETTREHDFVESKEAADAAADRANTAAGQAKDAATKAAADTKTAVTEANAKVDAAVDKVIAAGNTAIANLETAIASITEG